MKNSTLIILFLFLYQFAAAQLSTIMPYKNLDNLQQSLSAIPQNLQFSKQIQHLTLNVWEHTNFSRLKNDQSPMPSVYAFKELAFFCKIEVQLEKAVRMPVKFRLGSVDDVDYLEGKRDKY